MMKSKKLNKKQSLDLLKLFSEYETTLWDNYDAVTDDTSDIYFHRQGKLLGFGEAKNLWISKTCEYITYLDISGFLIQSFKNEVKILYQPQNGTIGSYVVVSKINGSYVTADLQDALKHAHSILT